MFKIIVFVVGFECFVQICSAQDSISMNDAKVIKARSEITIGRYLNTLLNTISYTGADNIDIKDLIVQSLEGDDKKIFLDSQIAIADDISDPNYTNSMSSPDVSVVQYLNAFNTFYTKSDTNSVYFTDVRSSPVKKGKTNIYVNVYFTSYFKNRCLSNPAIPYTPAKRVAEIFIKRDNNNKWLLYISRISFLNAADTVNDLADNITITESKKQTNRFEGTNTPEENSLAAETRENEQTTKAFNDKMTEGNTAFANHNYALARDAFLEALMLKPSDETPRIMLTKLPMGQVENKTDSSNNFSQYIDKAKLEEKKRNYQTAISLYFKAIDLDPTKRNIYEGHIKELNNSFRILAELEEKYRAGDYKSAIKGYSEHIKKPKTNSDPSNSDYYLGRAKCFDKMGQLTKSYNEQVRNYGEAMEDYGKSYEYDNENLETIRCRADLFRRMNRNVKALTEYKTYLAKNPTDIAVYEAMSDLHVLNGNIDQAITDIDAALSQEKIDPIFKSKLNVDKGILYVLKKDYPGAEDYFTRAISLDSNNALAYYNRGMGRVKINRIQSAANDFIAARRKGLDSTSIKKIDSSGNIYPGALESYYMYIASHPGEIPSSLNYEMGNIYLNTGKFDSAYTYLFKSYQSDSANGYILYSMATCIYLRGNTEESLKWFERSFRTKALDRNFVEHDILLRSLQDDRRYKDLKKKYY
jgi:tetratricopeptide (TPR) repeat protein